ncbi:hypothetical protein [Streptomyces aureoverticillatus]|uniref:hypothetical protein n=1 Tax=Streptomyces aureoverticillatus TaxID=66871 RepID=UPI0013DAB3F9|nr:hypothetical protein [Streptomyces aureoverticillatus]QIB49529.1 hypothetical protein G3H79_40895 [Streptomyces aureoverticillatus]
MNTTLAVVEFKDIGDNLFTLGTSWAEKALKLGLLFIVVITIFKKMSLKGAIGSLIGLAIALGVYNGRDDVSTSFTSFLLSTSAPVHAPLHPGAGTDAPPAASAGGERV